MPTTAAALEADQSGILTPAAEVPPPSELVKKSVVIFADTLSGLNTWSKVFEEICEDLSGLEFKICNQPNLTLLKLLKDILAQGVALVVLPGKDLSKIPKTVFDFIKEHGINAYVFTSYNREELDPIAKEIPIFPKPANLNQVEKLLTLAKTKIVSQTTT